MAKKLFTIHRTCTATLDVSVTAETEEEAINLARDKFDRINPAEFCFDTIEDKVINAQDYDDPEPLIPEAINAIMQDTDFIGDAVSFEPVEVETSVYVWDEVFQCGDYENRTVCVDAAYLQKEDDDYYPQIIVQFDEDHQRAFDLEDTPLSEFSEVEQLHILQAILA